MSKRIKNNAKLWAIAAAAAVLVIGLAAYRWVNSAQHSNTLKIGISPPYAELLKSGYRYVIAGQYLCVYRLIVDTVFVYHIVHGASNYPVLFKRLLQEELKRED